MNHEFDGKKYGQASAHQKEWGQKILDELNLVGNERILDLGCGDGEITFQIAEHVPNGEVIGIDASKGMIDAALERKKDNLKFIQMDINRLDYDNEFDIIFSNATLHWVKDHENLLKNVYKASKSGGKIRFNFAADGNCSNFYRVIKEAIELECYSKYFDKFDWPWFMPKIEEYEEILKAGRFEKYEIWGENADRYFPNIDAMVKWIDQPSIVPFILMIDNDKKDEFRDYVIKRMVTDTVDQNGRCFETFRRINLKARK
jgi:trans-aconitate 2-methyltransferase